MLRKVFKTILVLSLCAGLAIPTNAAVSVSDGSAFVTKAEFSADLNNLSNRMAQLENSLDAKIDSLVSSYLTRNGIWNGAKQTLAATSFKYGFKSASSRASNLKKWFNIFGATVSISNYALYRFSTVGASGRTTIINEADKSGLLFINNKAGTITNDNMTACPACNTDYINLANMRWIYNCRFDFEVNSGTSWIVSSSVSCQLIGFGTGTYLYCPSLSNNSINFFVSKGDKVAINVTQQILEEGTTGNDPTTLAAYVGNQESSRNYVLSDTYIY